MKKNENIFISLELQKDLESKGLLLSVLFDKNAPNFFEESDMLSWCPTSDELSFIKEAFDLIGENTGFVKQSNKTEEVEESPSMMETAEYSHRSSEIRIAPLPNNMTLEVEEGVGSSHQRDGEEEEKIFIQADEKKIDEILKRKKNAEKEQVDAESDDKELIDKIMKQKKKK